MACYDEFDVTGWVPDGVEVLGTKPKRWLKDPGSGLRWLMKDTTFNTNVVATSDEMPKARYRKGDDWAERVACAIAERLDLPTATAELAVSKPAEASASGDRVYGVISQTLLNKGENLVQGVQLLQEVGILVSQSNRAKYSVAAVYQTIEKLSIQSSGADLAAWPQMAGYLVLDALIGNTDRHEENWAVVTGEDGRMHLAPTFDHASSLGFQLSDERRQRQLTTRDANFKPEAYADRARTPFAGRPHPIDAAATALELGGIKAGGGWLEGCRADDLAELIHLVPHHRMSVPARKFAELVLRRNWHRLKDRLG